MRIAYCGQDFLLPVLEALWQDGHETPQVITGEGETAAISTRCRERGVQVRPQPLAAGDFPALAQVGVELILCAGYAHKVPDGWQAALPMGLNIHASPLPRGRGPWPLTWTILNGESDSAVVLHKLADQWDSGDLVVTQPLSLSATETAGSLSAKVRLHAISATRRFLADPHRLWHDAQPQRGAATTWPMPSEAERRIDWQDTVSVTLRRVRAFSDVGALAQLGDQQALIKRATGWQAAHDHAPGTIVLHSARDYLIAVPDGYIYLE